MTKQGIPKWLLVGCAALVGLLLIPRGNSLVGSDDAAEVPGTTEVNEVVEPEAVVVQATASVGVLTHGESKWVPLSSRGVNEPVVVRAGSAIVVIDPDELLAHRIDLPQAQANAELGRVGHTISLVAEKVIVLDNGFLRSLSTNGGVDLLLSNASVGFEVATETSIVAAIRPSSGPEHADQVRLVPQGVHYPSARQRADEFFGSSDRDVLPEGAALIHVQGKLFVAIGDELFRKTDDGLVSLGSGRVFAAGSNHVIVERCTALFEYCSYYRLALDGSSEFQLDVPLEFSRSNVVLSNDGNELFVLDDGTSSQVWVDISDGGWEVIRSFADSHFTAATFAHQGSMLVLAQEDSLVFWRAGQPVTVWELSGVGHIDEIATSL